MATIEGRPQLPGAERWLLRGYGPLLGMVVGLLMIAFLVPTVQPEVQNVTSAPGTITPGATVPGKGTDTGSAGADGTPDTTGGTADPGASPVAPGEPPPAAVACEGPQIPNDPYSPPCIQWAGGDNGGATAQGVDATTINITVRTSPLMNIGALIAQLTGGAVQVDEDLNDIKRTYDVLAEYFNSNFEFYGRKIKINYFEAQGDLAQEILGGGQAGAQADAINAAQQQNAFADALSITQPYAEALINQGVISLNQAYFSEAWYRAHDGFAYSLVPDCTKAARTIADFMVQLNQDDPAAVYAGGDLNGRPRKIGVLAPDNPIYQDCVKDLLDRMKASGVTPADVRSYPLDLNSLTSSTPQNMVSAFAGAGITSVLLLTDPVLPIFMASKADQQDWTPEWILGGVGYSDLDLVGQFIEPDQWKHAFGISNAAEQLPSRASDAYYAYKSIDPDGNPAELTGQALYYSMLILSIGIQGAGPNLTPETFRQGLQRYPGGQGQAGFLQFTPEDPYTPERDFRVISWDATAVSTYNREPGSYVSNGERYVIGEMPSPLPLFPNGGP